MKNTIKSRKGVTLTELVVVLAVVVIAAGMVVTFSSMMHGAQGISNERYEALQDVRTAEALIEGFILNNTEEGYYVKWEQVKEENGEIIVPSTDRLDFYMATDSATISKGDNRYVFLKGNKGNNIFVMTDKDVMFFEHITSIEFWVECGKLDIYVNNNSKTIVEDPDSNNPIFYSPASADILYYCTITYEVAGTPYTYTFCVNPYVGEGVN